MSINMSLRRMLSSKSGLVRDTRAQQHVSKSARVDSCEGPSIHDDNICRMHMRTQSGLRSPSGSRDMKGRKQKTDYHGRSRGFYIK